MASTSEKPTVNGTESVKAKTISKRKQPKAASAIEMANKKSNEAFLNEYMKPEWVHNKYPIVNSSRFHHIYLFIHTTHTASHSNFVKYKGDPRNKGILH